ncbi:MAG: hypothetical protein V4592_13920 [Bacteroidota bacterium]
MKTQSHISNLQDRPFNGKLHLKLKRSKQQPRQKIRQLLRSFEPLNKPPENAQRSGPY